MSRLVHEEKRWNKRKLHCEAEANIAKAEIKRINKEISVLQCVIDNQ